MKIEEGKYYKTRDGQKVGPMRYDANPYGPEYPWFDEIGANYSNDGVCGDEPGCVVKSKRDIISEWPAESPVRTVTKREIVPGVYGKVRVYDEDCDKGHACLKIGCDGYHWTDAELRAAAATLIEIADALEDV